MKRPLETEEINEARRRPAVNFDHWGRSEWRRLEQALVDLKRHNKDEGESARRAQVVPVESEEVVEVFLESEKIDSSALRGEWTM